MRWGIKAFLAEAFAEIFFGNCVALGLPCFTATNADIAQVMGAVENTSEQIITLDLECQQVSFNDGQLAACIPDGTRHQFIDGNWDALGQLLAVPDKIKAMSARLPYMNNFD